MSIDLVAKALHDLYWDGGPYRPRLNLIHRRLGPEEAHDESDRPPLGDFTALVGTDFPVT